jgi:HD-like signal output (HDOD) protein
VIELDAGMTVRVLRLANSALFGHAGKIEKVSHAIVMIGERSLRDLVLATSVTNVFKGIPREFVDMSTFWDNSVTCGVVARMLAERCGIREVERLFVAGLLHGIGRLIFFSRQGDKYREVLKMRDQGEAALVAEERRVFGFTYADLGGALAAAWKLPEFFQEVISNQLEPGKAANFPKEAAILHVARDIARDLAPNIQKRQPPGPYRPEHDLAAREMLGIGDDELENLRIDALAQSFDVIEIINPGSSTIF